MCVQALPLTSACEPTLQTLHGHSSQPLITYGIAFVRNIGNAAGHATTFSVPVGNLYGAVDIYGTGGQISVDLVSRRKNKHHASL